MRFRSNSSLALTLLAFPILLLSSSAQAADAYPFSVQIVQASKNPGSTSKALKSLAKELSALKFKSFQLKNEIAFKLAPGASGKIQLPGGEWLKVKVLGKAEKEQLRIEVAVAKLAFATVVLVAPKARVVVRGPPFGEDTLVLVVTRKS